MKPILAIDLDGALMYSRPFRRAHVDWFRLFSILLSDKSITEYANTKDYWKHVHDVMERYLGHVDKGLRVRFARELYSMVTIADVKEDDLCKEFATFLKSIKKNYRLVLVTTTPEVIVDAVLQKLKVEKLFDLVYKSKMSEEADKRKMFKEFIKDNGKPLFYIGDGDEHISICKELGIKTISVNWVAKAEIKGDFDVETVDELKKAL
ncbi:HAD hydrolase-like protein [Candidatus Woesearchaeota archaeon]|nr:HAD hydrolase-like protein [Candidatus Woesearchaeota archaeon]MBW3022276.1 HAD hydrolase-like protein [Candidatus Woesearchaeota archaeon]